MRNKIKFFWSGKLDDPKSQMQDLENQVNKFISTANADLDIVDIKVFKESSNPGSSIYLLLIYS